MQVVDRETFQEGMQEQANDDPVRQVSFAGMVMQVYVPVLNAGAECVYCQLKHKSQDDEKAHQFFSAAGKRFRQHVHNGNGEEVSGAESKDESQPALLDLCPESDK